MQNAEWKTRPNLLCFDSSFCIHHSAFLMSPRPTISVLMSVYNGQAFVGQAVESILAQTFGDFEFLILDDGSTDRSMDVLGPIAGRDKRVKLTTRPNKGLTRTLNELFRQSQGEFI